MRNLLLLFCLFAFSFSAFAQSMIVNRYFNSATSDGTGDIAELVVVTDRLNIKKWLIKDHGNGTAAVGGRLDEGGAKLYQEIGNSYNDFQLRLGEWSQNSYKAALMVGYAFYKFGDPTSPTAFQTSTQLQSQFNLANLNSKVVGSVMYSAKYFNLNKVGITDKLTSIYQNPAVMPFLGRTVAAAPTVATNVRIENSELKWTSTGNAKSVVYFFSDVKKEGKVLVITKLNTISLINKGFYSVSTLNVDNQESKPSNFIELK